MYGWHACRHGPEGSVVLDMCSKLRQAITASPLQKKLQYMYMFCWATSLALFNE